MVTAPVTIGGKEYTLHPLSFFQLKKIWPTLQRHMNKPQLGIPEDATQEQIAQLMMDSEMAAAEDAIQILSVAMNDPEKTPEWIEHNLLASEMGNLQPAMINLLQISGLVPEGNGLKELDEMIAQFQTPSTVTSTN